MPKLRVLSGPELIALFRQWNFHPHTQRGSHVKLRRTLPSGATQSLTIPRHGELDAGTLRAIMRQAMRFISEEELRGVFYTDT